MAYLFAFRLLHKVDIVDYPEKTCFRSCDRLLNISLLLVLKVFENMVGMQVK